MVIREHDANWHDYPPMEVGWKAQSRAQGGIRYAVFRRLQPPAPAWRLVLSPCGPVPHEPGWNRNPHRRPGSNNTAQDFLSKHESRHCSPLRASRHWLPILERYDKVSSQWRRAAARKQSRRCGLADWRVLKFLPLENGSRESSLDRLRSLTDVHGNIAVNVSRLGSAFP